MNKAQYIKWLATRGPIGEWKMEECAGVDRLIRETALKNTNDWIDKNVATPAHTIFKSFLSAYFGSVEVDDFLVSINAYPDWMEQDKEDIMPKGGRT